MATWDGIYRTLGAVQGERPSEQIVGIVPILKERGVKRVLDHGCGAGRHTFYLAGEGFEEVVGMDNSDEGLKKARTLVRGYPNVQLVKAEMDAVPYVDGYFGAVISSHVVQHALAPQREGAFREFGRVIRRDGLLFLRTISTEHSLFGRGRQIESGTFVDIAGLPDGDMPHHYFNQYELKDLLSDFEIERMEHKSHPARKEDVFPHGLEEWVVLARRK